MCYLVLKHIILLPNSKGTFLHSTVPHTIPSARNKLLIRLIFFRTLRKLFKVDPADYMISLCGNDALRELSSPGKSGSFFYLTNDDRYMIKTMKKAEVKVRFISVVI